MIHHFLGTSATPVTFSKFVLVHKNLLLSLVVGLSIFAGGCSGGGEAAATPNEPTATVASEKAKCDFCGTEVAKAELASHDGKMACKKCIEAHNH